MDKDEGALVGPGSVKVSVYRFNIWKAPDNCNEYSRFKVKSALKKEPVFHRALNPAFCASGSGWF
jgi:hypothetical protein